MNNPIEQIKKIPLGIAWRHAATAAALLVTLWSCSGPFIQSQAEDVFIEMLTKQGMSPNTIKEMQRQLKDLDQDLALTRGDLNTLKQDSAKQLSNQEAIKGQGDKTYDLLLKIIPMIKTDNFPQ